MELEEIQNLWADLSEQVEKQKKLTDKMIIDMTQQKYNQKLHKIAKPEMIGALICFTQAGLILFNIHKLDNWYNLLFGILSLLILIVLPILSLNALRKLQRIDLYNNTYKDTLLKYTSYKSEFKKVMRLGGYISFLLMFLILPVFTKIFKNKDIFEDISNPWVIVLFSAIAIVFMIFFSRWVFKCYTNNIDDAEKLIEELQ